MTRGKRDGGDGFDDIARGLEGLMGQFGKALGEAMARLAEGEGSASSHSRVFETGKGPVRAEIGLRLRGIDGSAPPRTAGRPRPAQGRAAAEDVRTSAAGADAGNGPGRGRARAGRSPTPDHGANGAAPDGTRLVELTGYADRGGWTVAADLPGVAPDDLDLDVLNGTLQLATRGERAYRGAVALPPGVEGTAMTVTLRNGVLSIYFPPAGTAGS